MYQYFAISDTDTGQRECGRSTPIINSGNEFENQCSVLIQRCIFLLIALKGPDKICLDDDISSDEELEKLTYEPIVFYTYVLVGKLRYIYSCFKN